MKFNNNIFKDNYIFLNSMDDWVRLLDSNGNVIYMNEAMKKSNPSIKIDKCSLLADTQLSCISPQTINLNTTVLEEKRINERYYDIKSSPIYDNSNKFMGTIEVYRDVTSEVKIKNELFNANRKMIDDIRFAKNIQQKILPKNGKYSNLIFSGLYKPSDDLSGDMYDIIKISEDKYYFYVADVMGHGVVASIMTMFVKQTVNAIIDKHPDFSPSMILSKLNDKFIKLNEDTESYFTIWIGLFDTKNNKLIFSNAGHNCIPLIKRNNEIFELYAKGKMISNYFKESIYEEKTFDLSFGDEILFYTDGLTESENENGQQFGEKRLKNLFLVTSNPFEIIKKAQNFSWNEQKDDIVIVNIKYGEKNDK
ncbi:MAG: SpoIIE family protein phosphatase [Peptoniphilaceae bacterium]|nr:SpoIIE family protein phosphatase [Peptoniphilaceae bacterium]MDD7382937.1 SpoIIE family protein phosphatase [Peptoniphilaceae bacterium]MDY3737688.1 SpoIIE family protein phosphatase [Peptoniphilaceae bacterium]